MLQQNDIDALLAALAASQESESSQSRQRVSEVKIYDFVQPDNLPSEFMRALETINASFARSLSATLSGYLSAGVQVEPLSADQMTYRQFCDSVPETTAIGTFTLTPLEGVGLIELNPHIAWFLLERGLGGRGEVPEEAREYTPLEKGLLDDLVFRRILRELARAWRTLVPLRSTLREVVNSPTIARIAQPDDRMVVCTFGINISEVTGMSAYCIPVSSLDFERMLNSDSDWDEQPNRKIDDESERAEVIHNLLDAPLCVRACLPDIIVQVGELAALQPGDVIQLDALAQHPIEVRVGSQRRFHANPVTVLDKAAVEILGEWKDD